MVYKSLGKDILDEKILELLQQLLIFGRLYGAGVLLNELPHPQDILFRLLHAISLVHSEVFDLPGPEQDGL